MEHKRIGTIKKNVILILGLDIPDGIPIYLGQTNIQHMQNKHPSDYQKYGDKISDILENPDYIGLNPADGSLEYVKEYMMDNEFVKVAVRVSGNDTYFARSLYILNNNRVQNFIKKGTLIKV